MKKIFISVALICISLTLAGCGGGHSGSDQVVTQILSDPTYDGDILKDTTGVYTVTQGMSASVQSVFAGIDPATSAEYRAFLSFPLGGAGGVPVNAFIAKATLDIVINNITPYPLTGTIPIRIDLVSFSQPMIDTDFDRSIQPALATITPASPITQADFGNHVSFDVTSLMAEAQRLGLASFQIRIMEDLGIVSPGFIEINDTTGANQAALAPLLEVTYY